MAIGKSEKLLSNDDHKRVAKAVEEAEAACGLQILVYLGRMGKNPRQAAIAKLQRLGFQEIPGVFILIEPQQHNIEVVTSEQARNRLPDEACKDVIAAMVPALRDQQWVQAIEVALQAVARLAGPGDESLHGELPDVIE